MYLILVRLKVFALQNLDPDKNQGPLVDHGELDKEMDQAGAVRQRAHSASVDLPLRFGAPADHALHLAGTGTARRNTSRLGAA